MLWCGGVQGNAFHGTLPASWGEQDTWPSLAVLFLNDNNLTGTLPPVCCKQPAWGDSEAAGCVSH